MELPVYWTNLHRDVHNDEFALHYVVDSDTKDFLEKIAQHCAKMRLRVISAKRIESSSMWYKYVNFKCGLNAKLQSQSQIAFPTPAELNGKPEGVVLTKQVLRELHNSQAVSAQHLNTSLNELILWHGTKKNTVEKIVRDGFHIPNAHKALHGTRFGGGAYLAEDIGKSMAYAKADSNGHQWILLCRALCGDMHYIEDDNKNTASDDAKSFDKDAVLANPGGEGPREFIMLTESQVYPEYVLEVEACG